MFSAYVSSDVPNFAGDGTVATIPFNAASYNSDNCFDLGSYTFIVPSPGLYLFSAGIKLTNFAVGVFDTLSWTILNTTDSTSTTISLLDPEPYYSLYDLSLSLNGFGSSVDLSLARADQVCCQLSVSGDIVPSLILNGSATELMTFLNCYKVT
jgi:hypothetical protein